MNFYFFYQFNNHISCKLLNINIILKSFYPFIMLILKMGKIFNVGYERVMLLYNPAIYNTADVINTYVYRKGLIDAQFSYSTAVGMFNCLVSFALVMITNKISQKVNGSGLW